MHDVAPMQALAAGMAYLASLVHLWRYLSPETAPGLRSRTLDQKNRGKGRVRSLMASVLFLLAGITWTVVAVQTAEEEDRRARAEADYRDCVAEESFDNIRLDQDPVDETPAEACEHLLPAVRSRPLAGDLVITSQGAGAAGHQRPDALP
jgi:hypothetical protein